MITDRINPASLYEIPGIAQLTVASGTRSIHLSGQAAFDPTGNVVGSTHREQTAQSLRNMRKALEAGGALPTEVVSMTMYVVNYTNDALDEIYAAIDDIAEESGVDPSLTAVTLIGVACLWQPSLLIEIAATAIV